MVETTFFPDDFHAELWGVSKPIGPRQTNNADDVALIQTMLGHYLASPDIQSPEEKAEADKLLTNTVGKGKKFVDGIYGANTRAAVFLLERRIGSPIKDGVIRPVGQTDSMGRMSGLRGTKAFEINEIWDTVSASDSSKKLSGKQFLTPRLFNLLYPRG